MEFTGSYTKSEEFLQECENYIDSLNPLPRIRRRSPFSNLLKRSRSLAGKAVYHLHKQSNLTPLNNVMLQCSVYGEAQNKSIGPTKLECLYQGKRPLNQYLADFYPQPVWATDARYLTRRLSQWAHERLRLKR